MCMRETYVLLFFVSQYISPDTSAADMRKGSVALTPGSSSKYNSLTMKRRRGSLLVGEEKDGGNNAANNNKEQRDKVGGNTTWAVDSKREEIQLK